MRFIRVSFRKTKDNHLGWTRTNSTYLTPWTDEDENQISRMMRTAHRVYGGCRWVPVERFMMDVRNDFEALCGMRCPRVTRLSLLLHKNSMGSRSTRGFDDAFVHGRRVLIILPNFATSVYASRLMEFMDANTRNVRFSQHSKSTAQKIAKTFSRIKNLYAFIKVTFSFFTSSKKISSRLTENVVREYARM